VTDRRWEHGGFFQLALPPGAPSWPHTGASVFYRSATDALRDLLDHAPGSPWARLHLPTYYCHDVTDVVRRTTEVSFYDDGPTREGVTLELEDDEVAVVVEYFGASHHVTARGGTLILDRTHDPFASWAYERVPDYAIASLRKTLPLPDGGMLWSPRGSPLPRAPGLTGQHRHHVVGELTAMALRSAFLAGADLDKQAYLSLHAAAEEQLGEGAISGMSDLSDGLLRMLPVAAMRTQRSANLAWFRERWTSPQPWLRAFDTPSYVILLTDGNARRDALRSALIARDVYPAVLWELRDVPAAPSERGFAERMLACHADFRYDAADMERFVAVLAAASADLDRPDPTREPPPRARAGS
jgi:hypothetical protein